MHHLTLGGQVSHSSPIRVMQTQHLIIHHKLILITHPWGVLRKGAITEIIRKLSEQGQGR